MRDECTLCRFKTFKNHLKSMIRQVECGTNIYIAHTAANVDVLMQNSHFAKTVCVN